MPKLGPYEILSPLGEGGMGQVWKARDTRLNRFVAIKTSHQAFSERFEREALAIAALNHPHICSLFDVGPDYLVMEYVEGKPIQGPLPIEKALQYAGQILDALDAAHRKGITHRDLKPGNILLGVNGIKILDFGLAKIERAAAALDDATMTMPLTSAGSIMGTLQYMAPEQLEGKEADARSDIFAFGLILYELITGQRAYSGATQATIIASILKDHPRPVRELQPLTSPGLERVLETCLEKDPDKRWQSAREVKHALDWMGQAAQQAAPAVEQSPAAPGKSAKLPWTIVALLAVIAPALAGWIFWPRSEPPPPPITRFQVLLPENATFGNYLSLSPDGRKLVVNTTGEDAALWIRDLDALEWRRLQDTDGAVSPFWSPDSKFIAFAVGNQLKKIEVSGGPAQTLCTIPTANSSVGSGSWNSGGVILFGGRGSSPLWRIPQAGGVPTPVTAIDASRSESFHALPTFLPDGKHFIYLRTGTAEGLYAGSLDAKPEEQPKNRILAVSLGAFYVNGSIFFIRDNTLMAQPFDAGKLQMRGEPVPVAEHVDIYGRTGVFSVSPSGALAYHPGAGSGNYQLTWFDRQGNPLGTVGQPATDRLIRLSPDGMRGAVRDSGVGVPGDLWTIDFARGLRTRFTFHQSAGSGPVWSADGNFIAFAAGNLLDSIYERASSGAGDEKELLRESGTIHLPTSLSRDGRFLLYHTANVPKTNEDLWVLPLQGDRKPLLLLGTQFSEQDPAFSPDMRWIAYASNESGRYEVYVRPFLPSGPSGSPSFGEGKWQVSRDGGGGPIWSADGKEIFFRTINGTAKMAVDVKANGAVFESGAPRQLFTSPLDIGWDVAPDGKRFLMSVPQVTQNGPIPLTVVLNWPTQLKK